MTFLPVVERELRIAARKPSTFWLRVATAAVALGLGVLIGLTRSIGGVGSSMLGQAVFSVLTWGALITALMAGLFLTSDCLSEEKREGTLGFLFLTDLKGYDIVGGKLLASSLRAFYALLALFPILAITLLMGGVTGEQFWKTSIALANSLLFSLTIGMLVSSFCRDAQKALSTTLLLLMIFNIGGPALDGLISGITKRGFIARASLASPAFLFTQASGWSGYYRNSLALTHGLTWLSFAVTSILLPRAWQEKTLRPAMNRSAYSWKYGGVEWRKRFREKWLSIDPMVWMSCRERWAGTGMLVIALLGLIALVLLLTFNRSRNGPIYWHSIGWLYTFIFYVWSASQSGRYFFELRRSGMMELLLSTPLNEKQIVMGRWRAMRKILGFPLLIFICVQGYGFAVSNYSMVAFSGPGRTVPFFVFAIINGVANVVVILANIAAICWFGMWMGMISKSGNLATLRTYLFVQVVPAILISIGSTLLIFSFARLNTGFGIVNWFGVVSILLSCLLGVGKDIAFISWSRNRLFRYTRVQAGHPIGQARVAAPKRPPRLLVESVSSGLAQG